MATGGVFPETEDPMICHICMEVYRNPKFLPCFHSFCAQCIQDWASQNHSRSRSSFPCPVCRQETSLPKGGVEKLQTNFYFNEETLEKARTGKLCRVHQNKVLELFCVPCQRVICLKCGVLDHGSHQILDLDLVVSQKKKELSEGRQRVLTTIRKLRENKKRVLSNLKRNQEQLSKAQDVIHCIITSIADVFHWGAKKCLQSSHNHLADHLTNSWRHLLVHEQELEALDGQLTEAVKNENAEEMSSVIKQLKSGRGSKINAGYGFHPSFYCFIFLYPVLVMLALLCGVYFQQETAVKDFETFKTVLRMPFKMMEQFKCAGERDTEVYSLCVMSSRVVVSYTQRGLKEDAASQTFTKTGQMLEKHVNVKGKATWVRVDQRCVFFDSIFDSTSTFSKSKKLFALTKVSSDMSVIDHYTPHTREKTEDVHFRFVLFTIHVQKFRTFDADSTGNFFAVIEEGQSPNLQRRVKIFRKPYSTPFATYAPPNMTLQPADVCFYEMRGKDFLLVADEWDQHIHVVRVDSSELKPLGYLKSNCPESRTPTALNVDDEGDLWLACKGGAIIKTKYIAFR